MNTNILLLGLVAFVLIFAQFVLLPLRLFFTHKSRVLYYRPFDPQAGTAHPEIERLIAATVSTLASREFEIVGHYSGSDKVRLRFTLLNRTSQGDRALLADLRTAVRSVRFVEFDSTFADGSELSTSNSTNPPGTFAQLPKSTRLQFPKVRDPLEVYELHLAACKSFFPGLEKVRYSARALEERFVTETRRLFEHQVARGLMRRTKDPDVYAPTLKGACLMTWKNVFPIASIRRMLFEAKMRQIHDRLADLVAAEGWQE